MNVRPFSNPDPSLKFLPAIGPTWFGMIAVLFIGLIVR